MPDLSKRSTQPELMDSEIVTFEEFDHCLYTLEKINILTLAYRPTLQWLRHQKKQDFTLFDIGSGGGDMLRRIIKIFPGSSLTGIDLNLLSAQSALKHGGDNRISYETTDIFSLALDRKADFIVSSLFTHHLSDEQIVVFLRWMNDHSSNGWFINDLHRHFIPFHFIRIAVHALRLNRLVRHDAPLSVARAFTRQDWQNLIEQAGLDNRQISIRWHFPFRLCVAGKTS